jgi:hypothetical protein
MRNADPPAAQQAFLTGDAARPKNQIRKEAG